MNKKIILTSPIFLSLFFVVQAQIVPLPIAENSPSGKVVTFNVSGFNQAISNAGFTNGLTAKFETVFPMPDGSARSFTMGETLISTEILKSIKTFDGTADQGRIKMKITLSENNRMTGIMHSPDGYFYIEPKEGEQDQFLMYPMSETPSERIQCGTLDEHMLEFMDNNKGRMTSLSPFPAGTQLRIYRMAAAATGEFVTHYGSQSAALAKIVEVMNAANLIYELEASIRFQLISATTSHTILFTNASTDPFTPSPGFASASASQNGFNNMNSSGILNYNMYDVGHTFNVYAPSGPNSYSAQGQAGPTPCINTQKSRGWTQWSNNALSFSGGLSMVVGVFVHEVGHQFSAWHTYNAVGGSVGSPDFCTGGWSSDSAVEPGSGSTLMGYGGNCSHPTNYVLTGDNNLNYFHTKSLEQIFNAVNGSSGTCITNSATGNTPPVANAGSDITIPKGTPFILQGSATDANGDPLTYTWEQYDVATANDKGALGSTVTGTGGYSAVNSTTAPLFRSSSGSSGVRFLPYRTHILNSANNPADNEGEHLPLVARSLKFRMTVRDGLGGVDSDETIYTVVNSGPFLITSQNSPTAWIYNGTNTSEITWSVNGTNAAPLNVTNVKITMSTDGGWTFSTTLAASTPNDGSHVITIPNIITSQARIRIEPVGLSYFFDINNANISILTNCLPETTTISPQATVSAQEGHTSLNLQIKALGASLSNFTGTLSSSSTTGNLSFEGLSGGCQGPSNSNVHTTHTFVVSTAGTYTFTGTTYTFGTVMNLYSETYNRSSVCTNWLASSGKNTSGGVNLSNSVSATLSPGVYVLVVSSFNTTLPSLPVNFVISYSGGTLYNQAPALGSPYAYTFLVKNNASGNIVAFSDNTDLRNASIYTSGNYTVYGLSYAGGLNLTPFIGTSFSSFQSLLAEGSVCGKLSSNQKTVIISGPCPSIHSLNGVASSGKKQASVSITSTQVVNSGQNVDYRAAKFILLEPQTGSGFEAKQGSLFTAEIKNCD